MNTLHVNEVWKDYGTAPVLRGLELDAQAGSLTAVLGLSGCGKTTLLRLIAGFERAQRGSIVLAGHTLDDASTYVPPERRGIGYVAQEGALFPHLNVRENVGFGLPWRERRGPIVTELLEMVGIEALAGRLPHELSGGEQQRAALARALARRPRALLLDEPFSSLDASLRGHVREEVHALLRAQGVTTLLVTHDQEEALSMADVVAVLRDGTIVQSAVPTDLYEHPVDETLARFLGAINVLDATFVAGRARTKLGALELREAPEHTGAGDAVGAVIVRPEQLQVRLRAQHEEPQGETRLPGWVEQCRYFGHDALLRIRTEDEASPILLARVLGEHALAAGTAVSVSARGPVAPISDRQSDSAQSSE